MKKTQLKDIGKVLALKRKERGLTQSDVGKRIKMQKSMVSKIENGRCLNFDIINRYAESLDMEPVVELIPLPKPSKKLIDYVIIAISEFSKRYKLSIKEASNYLNRFKGIEFLEEFYDVEHTLSFEDCVEDLALICKNNGGCI